MTDVERAAAVRVCVVLTPRVEDPGGWLADGAAYEASGAHALWVDPDTGPDLDPLVLAAALAAVTYRSLLVVPLPPAERRPPAGAHTLATLAKLARGRLALLTDTDDEGMAEGVAVVRRTGADTFAHHRDAGTAEPQRWLAVRTPDGRAAWWAAHREATEGGFHALVVPTGARLLDILRNPDEPDERRDLQLSYG